jgi:thymidylate synthase (FAD)
MTHQSVKAVAITQPLIEGVNTAEEFIAYAARVSNPSNQMNTETASKLLSYCVRNNHWSVFEQSSVTLEIKTTRDIARQILRHKSFYFQEFSQRYAEVTDTTTKEPRYQDTKNRQNSIEGVSEEDKLIWEELQDEVLKVATNAYSKALKRGIAKEVARSFLPEGLTMSTLYVTGTVRSWIHYCQLRSGNGTQKEHREIAVMAAHELMKHFPSIDFLNEDPAV